MGFQPVVQLQYFVNFNHKSKASFVKNTYTLRYWISISNLVYFIVSKALMNHPLDNPRHFFHGLELLPLDHAYREILVDGQDFGRLD